MDLSRRSLLTTGLALTGSTILPRAARAQTPRRGGVLTLRTWDPPRITIVRGGTRPDGKIYTKLYRVPPGADNPAP